MAASKVSKQRSPRPRFPLSEKCRIVELTLRKGASIRAIAQEQGVSRNSLRRWQALYRAGKLAAQSRSRIGGTPSATFLPVTIAPAAAVLQSVRSNAAHAAGTTVVQLMLASGTVLRIETGVLSSDLIRALLAELLR